MFQEGTEREEKMFIVKTKHRYQYQTNAGLQYDCEEAFFFEVESALAELEAQGYIIVSVQFLNDINANICKCIIVAKERER